jgi:hypothetical protein
VKTKVLFKRGGAALALMAALQAQANWLVTDQEANLSRAAPAMPEAKAVAVPGAPRIVLLQPDVTAAVASPTRIQLRFEPLGEAAIRPDTFKVRYGTLRLDITQRITAVSAVTPQGIDVSEAKLPKGAHRLYMEIQDSAGRIGERAVSFVVQ